MEKFPCVSTTLQIGGVLVLIMASSLGYNLGAHEGLEYFGWFACCGIGLVVSGRTAAEAGL